MGRTKARGDATKGPLWPLYEKIVEGRVVRRHGDGRRGVVVFPKHNSFETPIPQFFYMVRWDDAMEEVHQVSEDDMDQWLTDEFALDAGVPPSILDLQRDNWHVDFTITRPIGSRAAAAGGAADASHPPHSQPKDVVPEAADPAADTAVTLTADAAAAAPGGVSNAAPPAEMVDPHKSTALAAAGASGKPAPAAASTGGEPAAVVAGDGDTPAAAVAGTGSEAVAMAAGPSGKLSALATGAGGKSPAGKPSALATGAGGRPATPAAGASGKTAAVATGAGGKPVPVIAGAGDKPAAVATGTGGKSVAMAAGPAGKPSALATGPAGRPATAAAGASGKPSALATGAGGKPVSARSTFKPAAPAGAGNAPPAVPAPAGAAAAADKAGAAALARSSKEGSAVRPPSSSTKPLLAPTAPATAAPVAAPAMGAGGRGTKRDAATAGAGGSGSEDPRGVSRPRNKDREGEPSNKQPSNATRQVEGRGGAGAAPAAKGTASHMHKNEVPGDTSAAGQPPSSQAAAPVVPTPRVSPGAASDFVLCLATRRRLPAHLCLVAGDKQLHEIQPEDLDGDFVVERIMDEMYKGEQKWYLVKWLGFELNVGTPDKPKGDWEPEKHLEADPAMAAWKAQKPDWWLVQQHLGPETSKGAPPAQQAQPRVEGAGGAQGGFQPNTAS